VPAELISFGGEQHLDTWHFRARARLQDKSYTWVAARCFLSTRYTVRVAHSSPTYLGGTWNASADAQYFVQWIDALMAHIQLETDKSVLRPTRKRH
jgi:hypothetical protein